MLPQEGAQEEEGPRSGFSGAGAAGAGGGGAAAALPGSAPAPGAAGAGAGADAGAEKASDAGAGQTRAAPKSVPPYAFVSPPAQAQLNQGQPQQAQQPLHGAAQHTQRQMQGVVAAAGNASSTHVGRTTTSASDASNRYAITLVYRFRLKHPSTKVSSHASNHAHHIHTFIFHMHARKCAYITTKTIMTTTTFARSGTAALAVAGHLGVPDLEAERPRL